MKELKETQAKVALLEKRAGSEPEGAATKKVGAGTQTIVEPDSAKVKSVTNWEQAKKLSTSKKLSYLIWMQPEDECGRCDDVEALLKGGKVDYAVKYSKTYDDMQMYDQHDWPVVFIKTEQGGYWHVPSEDGPAHVGLERILGKGPAASKPTTSTSKPKADAPKVFFDFEAATADTHKWKLFTKDGPKNLDYMASPALGKPNAKPQFLVYELASDVGGVSGVAIRAALTAHN